MKLLSVEEIQLAFAKAYAESEDAPASARLVLAEVQRSQADIKAAVDAIRDFVLKGNPEANLPPDDEEERLTPAERNTITSLMDQTLTQRPEISPGEMIQAIEAAGIKLRERFQNPAAFIASNMKRRLRLLGEAATATPAAGQPASTPAAIPTPVPAPLPQPAAGAPTTAGV